jgi:hypothetical protein
MINQRAAKRRASVDEDVGRLHNQLMRRIVQCHYRRATRPRRGCVQAGPRCEVSNGSGLRG